MIQRYATEAEMMAVADAHYWHDDGSEMPWVALTGEDKPDDAGPVARCSKWQFRKLINRMGIRAQIDAYVALAGQDAMDGWETADYFLSSDPFIVAAAAALNLDAFAMIAEASGIQ